MPSICSDFSGEPRTATWIHLIITTSLLSSPCTRQELGHAFVKGFYGGDVWLQGIGGRPVVNFVVLDQADPKYTEQLFKWVLLHFG